MKKNDKFCNYPVAYFSAEYGLQANLPLYAGGLGVLSGDTVKEAGDQKMDMIAIGLLYKGINAIQKVDETGMQSEENFDFDPATSGFEHVNTKEDPDQPLFVKIHLTVEDVLAQVWKKDVHGCTMYLLDTDTDQNMPENRSITHALYYGSEEVLVKQQMLLGIGGVKVLHALGIKPCVYHVNEGRPAFLYWQLIRSLMDNEGLTYEEAKLQAKKQIVYTNHTLVRAGNQAYNTDLLKSYTLYYSEKMGVTIDELLQPGIDQTAGGKFSMTQFALNTSRKASAVSQIHYELSKQLWPEFNWVGITNGVHMPTWQDEDVRNCNKEGDDLWYVHQEKKQELASFLAEQTGYGYDPNRLVISWARRVAGYKRPNALFEDIERLVKILKHSERPVQLLISGKAHASDTGAKNMLQEMIQHMQNEVQGHALFIPNYNIDIAKMLVKGSDVWLNTPILGKEASGTSGMKAIANGVLQLTVEDGWAAEVDDWHEYGWSLDGNHLQQTLYFRLEEDVVPTFYHRDENGVPQDWLKMMKNSIELSQQYSTTRMLKEYEELLYS